MTSKDQTRPRPRAMHKHVTKNTFVSLVFCYISSACAGPDPHSMKQHMIIWLYHPFLEHRLHASGCNQLEPMIDRIRASGIAGMDREIETIENIWTLEG